MKISLYRVVNFLSHRHLLDWMPDSMYLKLRYRSRIKKRLNLKNPKTFNEKIQWLKLHDRNPEYIKLVDKYAVKEYVASIIGEQYIIPTLGVWDTFGEIDFDTLPNKFVLKCTHDSGGVVICEDKSTFDVDNAREKLEKSLKKNYYKLGREWPYKGVKPCIIAEKYLDINEDECSSNIKDITDYKLMCFNGKVRCTFTCTERHESSGLKVTFFDNDWNKMPFERHYPSSDKLIKPPKQFKEMIKLAEKLSEKIPFVRIDFYEHGNKIYFGEMTFYPGSGMEEFTPEEWDYKLGEMIQLTN